MKRHSVQKRGFTLIELLVVIAIIGVLASIVLASLNTARNKGNNAAIKANASNMRAQAELSYDTNNNYDSVCADTSILAQIDAAKSAAGITNATVVALATAGADGTATCHDSAAGYAIEIPMKDPTTSHWCVDSTGASSEKTTELDASDIACAE